MAQNMANARALLALVGLFSGQFYAVSAAGPNLCKTFGSGVFQTFNGSLFHVKSTCAFTLTQFTSAGVDCSISVQRGPTGLMNRVVILINKITTILQDGVVSVEGNSITLPYDHTYQHVYRYGIYVSLKSKVLPFSVTWFNSSGGISSLWVQLDRGLVDGMTGMCGRINSTENVWQLVSANALSDGTCVTEDFKLQQNKRQDCEVLSFAMQCLLNKFKTYQQLCLQNMYPNVNVEAKCAFLKEVVYLCGNKSELWSQWRQMSSCHQPSCAGDLKYQELGPAFPPTCSNPQANSDSLISTCLPPAGMVLNDRADGFRAVRVKDCPCVHGERTYAPGQNISSKCLSCMCKEGKWACSPNICPPRCIVEGQHVTTFDGKQYFLPGKCTYVAARGLTWTVTIKFSQTDMSIEEMNLNVYNERYTFTKDSVKLGDVRITDLSQTEHAIVSWQSSMFVQVQTSFGMKMQVQVSPEIQLYLYLPPTERTKGLCGTYNNNTEDDFTASSNIVENSARPFALSWAVGFCKSDDLPICINSNNAMFAEEKCSQLTNTSGVFAGCHDYVPVNSFVEACFQRTCQCTSGLEECLCVALGNYAKACASQGIDVGDWRAASSCSLSCKGNLRFSYVMQACNRTCRSISGPDPNCEAPGDPVEGCGCLPGTHLDALGECSPRALCPCSYPGGTVPPGHHVIDGRKCVCENGNLQCSKACDCPQGKVCVYCAQESVKTSQKTCKSLSQPVSSEENCTSGCYCPEGQYEDHRGNCVTGDNCTCEFSGAVYSSGQSVESNCRSCVCMGGKWYCHGEPCPGVCEVFGNGQYNTFDSKWYHFDGHCQYTLVEDASQNELFAVRVESVPCCDEALTCSRSVSLELQKEVTLTLRDMNVTQKLQAGWHLQTQQLYSIHTVGLYIIIRVPNLGLTLFWDRHTRVKVQLNAGWKGYVRGLCGNFDGKVMNDLLTSSSSVVFSTLEFGNSWKAAVPPCSDVTQEVFPCQRHSYCSAWAQRRCMILYSDTFKDCHLKVDPHPYYEACVLESCSCEFEGKFLGFCTAVAAYAEACTTQNICINWRTPDLCPVYCDYYNEQGQYSWHYEPCGQIKTCGKNNPFTGKLEGCYPRCPAERPIYDENTRKCSSLDKCTCYFNSTIIGPGDTVTTPNECCQCTGGNIVCGPCHRENKPRIAPLTPPPHHPETTKLTTLKMRSITKTFSVTHNSKPSLPITTFKTTGTPVSTASTTVATQTTTTSTTPKITRATEYTTRLITTMPVTTTATPSSQAIKYTTEEPTTPLTTTTPVTTTTTPSTSDIIYTTEEPTTPLTTTTPVTTNTTPSTSEIIYTTEEPTTPLTTTTPVATTTTPSTSDIIYTTEEPTTPLTTTTPVTTTTTPSTSEIIYTTEEPTTPITTTTPVATTTTPSTSEIKYTIEEPTTPLTTTTPVTTTTTPSTSDIIYTTEEPTTPLTTTTPVTTTTTPSTSDIIYTTEEPTTPLTTTTPVTTTTTPSTSEIIYTTEEPTTPLTTTTPVTTTTTPSTSEIIYTTEEPTTPLTTTTPVTTTTTPSTSEIIYTTEEPTTPLTTTIPVTTTTTPSTSEIIYTTEEPTTPLTTTTPVTTTTTPSTSDIIYTTEEPTTPLTTTTPVTTTTTPSTSEIIYTTEEPTTPLTTTTPVATTTTPSTSDIIYTTEEPTTPLTTTTPVTTTTTPSTSEIIYTTEEPTTPLTTTTPVATTTTPSTSEIIYTTGEPTTPLTTTTPVTTTTTPSTSEIIYTTGEPTTPLTTTTPVATTTTPSNSAIIYTTEEPTTPLTTTTPVTTTTTPSTSEIIYTTEEPTTPLTTTTPVATTTTPSTSEIIYTTEEPTTPLTTTTPVTTTTTPSTSEIIYTTEEPTTPLTTTTPVTTTTTPSTSDIIYTTEEPTTPLTTTTPVATTTTPSTSEIIYTTEEPTTPLTTTTPVTTTTTPSTSEIIYTTEEPTTPLTTTTPVATTTTPSTSEIIYTTEEPTTPLTTTTPVTTTTTPSTSDIIYTTEEPTTPLTTTTPVATTTTPSTSEIIYTTEEPTTPLTTTTLVTTTTTPSTSGITTVEYIPTTEPTTTAFCMDLLRNQTWPSGTEWTEDCFRKTCRNGVIEMKPVTCPLQDAPQCPRDLLRQVKDEQGCCDIFQCDCQCDIYGDPHYISFSGTAFNFMDNCTYVLVKEINPRHHLSITVDNYYCNSLLSGSCAKGIILKYLNNIVTLQVNNDEFTVEATLNDIVVQPPFEENGIRFENGDYQVSVSIDEIRSRVSLTPANTLEIILAMEFFYKNTQGQCGVCGGDSCVRRSGKAESDDCCDKTAYDWIEEDPAKPYCAHAPRNVPCGSFIPTGTPSTATTAPSCVAPLCDLLQHELFHECGKNIDMEALVQNCRFDYCLARSESSICSPLERLTQQCKKMGICVSWRNLTNGICNVTCPEGMYFDECHRTTNDVCHGGVRVPGKVLENFQSGCFCPDNQILAEKHKKHCVSECTYCKGPLGEPMPVGATWESQCHICTCKNQTQTEECWPKPPTPTPTCSANSTLVSDCCNNQICVEKTCEYNGKAYKVGDVWTDQLQPCVTLRCTSEGTELERRVCPQQSCPEDLRVWDEHQCCYTCNMNCSVRESRMSVTVENCKQEVTLPICEGFCQSNSMWVRSGEVLQLEQNRQCCRESSYEMRQLSLSCDGEAPTSYTYKHITGCECQPDSSRSRAFKSLH